MQITQPAGRFEVSSAELVKRFHAHETSNTDSRYKTAVLDVQLLLDAGLNVPDVFADCAVVGVKYAATTLNHLTHRRESVFSIYDANGNFHGQYFSSTFKALML